MALNDMYTALVGGWKLNNSLLDDVGSADLTNVNSVSLTADGKFGQCASIIRTSTQYLEYSGTSSFRIDDKKWFCSIWFKPTSISNSPTIIGRWADFANEWLLEVVSNSATFYVNCLTGGWFTVAQGTVSTSAWNFVIIAHDPDDNVIKISFNGTAFSTTPMTSGAANAITKLRFGAYGGDTGYWYDGLIDDVAIGEGYVPTDADAAAVYNNGTGVSWLNWSSTSYLDAAQVHTIKRRNGYIYASIFNTSLTLADVDNIFADYELNPGHTKIDPNINWTTTECTAYPSGSNIYRIGS